MLYTVNNIKCFYHNLIKSGLEAEAVVVALYLISIVTFEIMWVQSH